MAEDADHGAVRLFPLIHLLFHKLHELPLPCVEHERIAHAPLRDGSVERAADEVRRAQIVGALDMGHITFGGDHDDRELLQPAAALHQLQHAEAVQLRHMDVQQQQIDVRVLLQQLDGLHAVFGIQIGIAVPQNVVQQHTVGGGIVGDQQRWRLFHGILPVIRRRKRVKAPDHQRHRPNETFLTWYHTRG